MGTIKLCSVCGGRLSGCGVFTPRGPRHTYCDGTGIVIEELRDRIEALECEKEYWRARCINFAKRNETLQRGIKNYTDSLKELQHLYPV